MYVRKINLEVRQPNVDVRYIHLQVKQPTCMSDR